MKEWKQARERPENAKELYNFRHSSLRTVIERVFGQCKRKGKIIRHSAAEYSLTVQIKIVYAVTGLSNFIKLNGMDLDEYEAEQIEALGDDEREVLCDSSTMHPQCIQSFGRSCEVVQSLRRRLFRI